MWERKAGEPRRQAEFGASGQVVMHLAWSFGPQHGGDGGAALAVEAAAPGEPTRLEEKDPGWGVEQSQQEAPDAKLRGSLQKWGGIHSVCGSSCSTAVSYL